jgi:hypothetical protein
MALAPGKAQHIARKARLAREARIPEVTPEQDREHKKIAQAVMYARRLKQEGRGY